MIAAQRKEEPTVRSVAAEGSAGFAAQGGLIALLQESMEQRLVVGLNAQSPSRDEILHQFSRVGGYVALAVGYAVLACLLGLI